MAVTPEQRVSYIEGMLASLATKADLGELRELLAEMRGEVRAMRWTLAVVGVGISIVTLATRFIG